MTAIPVFGGPTKRDLIGRAYGMCGQSVAEFELSPEEYALGLQLMDDLAAIIGLPYNVSGINDADISEESGVPAADVLGFAVALAREISDHIGKSFSASAQQARAASSVLVKYQNNPTVGFSRGTPRGAGNRYLGTAQIFFPVDISTDEA